MHLPRATRRSQSIVMTSLVDVMFVLLFFFMLAASAVERRAIQIGLPAVAGPAPVDARELRLELHAPTRWILDGQPITPADLDARLRQSDAARIRVIPEVGVPVQVLADALMTVRARGMELRLGREIGP